MDLVVLASDKVPHFFQGELQEKTWKVIRLTVFLTSRDADCRKEDGNQYLQQIEAML